MNKSVTKVTIISAVLIVIVVGYYAYLSNKSQFKNDDANMTAVQLVLGRNLTGDYPSTPKEVVKYYNEIMKCFYNEECTEDELEDLVYKAREMYDAELLEANDVETNILNLKGEVKTFTDNKRRLTNCSVAASTNVVYDEIDGDSFAKIMCGYTVMEGSTSYPMTYTYLLRRDEQKRWKIYGWKDTTNQEEE